MMTIMIAALSLAAQAPAQQAVAKNGGDAATQPAPEKKICRDVMVTGSIMPGRRICRTAKEWQATDQANGDAFEAARYSRNRSWTKSPGLD